jgi:hypothetical protein
MLPTPLTSSAFLPDQTTMFEATYWDTTMTVPQSGIGFALFDILDQRLDLLSSAYDTCAACQNLINDDSSSRKLNAVLGYTSGAKIGITNNLYNYWGAGAPPGCKIANRVFLKYEGFVRAPDSAVKNVTFVFGGQGKLRVFKNNTLLKAAKIKEPLIEPIITDVTSVESDGGYAVFETTVQLGDQIDIYYSNNGEAWGGIVGKVLAGHNLMTDWSTFRTLLRDAPVIGPSFISTEALTGFPVPYITDVTSSGTDTKMRELSFEVILNNINQPNGFNLQNIGGQNQLLDNATNLSIKPGRLISFKAGFMTKRVEESYPRFTGSVVSITPSHDGDMATVLCQGFEQRQETSTDENYPDRLSYISNGYIDRTWKGFPVFAIGAFDAWPLETALTELCYRAGIDASNIGKSPFTTSPTFGRWEFMDRQTGLIYRGAKKFYARSLSDADELITVQRNIHYGNVGPLRSDLLLKDDEYLYSAKVSERLYDQVAELANRYGYDFYFDALGQAVIGARNNPQSFQFLSTVGPTQAINPAAIGGRFYRNLTSASWTKQFSSSCSRIDLIVGLGEESIGGLNGGVFQVDIEVHTATGAWEAVPGQSKTISTFLPVGETFYYDDFIDSEGNNLTVQTLFQLPFAEYRVTITPIGPDASDPNPDSVIRLNGISIYERDPLNSPYPISLSTVKNLFDLTPESQEKDLRNHVIVVGQRKADVTDSAKFLEENPNNTGQYQEFNVSVAADPFSQYDPQAANFVGGKRVAVVVDDKVADAEFASWLARTLLFRQRSPKLSATVSHTSLPMLDYRDPITLDEARDGSFPHLLWVAGFREHWTVEGEAETELTLTSYLEVPSFTPREDVDLSLFNNSPAFNLTVAYKNILGQEVVDPQYSTLPTIIDTTELITSITSHVLASGGFSDPLYLTSGVTAQMQASPAANYILNHPYRHYWHLSSVNAGTKRQTVSFDFQEGDGTAGVYDKTAYGFSTSWNINYKKFASRTGLNPFYDPYTSEDSVNNLVNISFDPLVSGQYRVSLWAINENGEFDFPVAWLTKPQGDPEEIEAHWSYIEAGSSFNVSWDGVDNVGLWNRYQSRDHAQSLEGVFGDKSILVGKGFYAWNDQATNTMTQIGDNVSENFDADNIPYFTFGKYSRFYIKVEAKSDRLLRNNADGTIFSVSSQDTTKTGKPAFYVFTHLGEPTQSYIRVEDWDVSGGSWNPTTLLSSWMDLDAYGGSDKGQLRNGKPVRVSFEPVPRRGILFHGEDGLSDNEKLSVQLTRLAHLKTTVFDQFWTFYGKPWSADSLYVKNKPENNPSNFEAKRLTSRMASDDSHTIEFANTDWLSGRTLKSFKWIFQPEFFKKDFGDGVESIRYCDYEQLYSLPGFDTKKGGGTDRKDKSFINLAFMNYVFYLSAHTLDRSGRRQFCLNNNFVDKSKIVTDAWLAGDHTSTPHYTTQYERNGADSYLPRSIFARQWVEPTWKTASGGHFYDLSPVDTSHTGTGGITDAWQLKWVQPNITDFYPLTSPMAAGGTEDKWSLMYATDGSQVNSDFWGFTNHWKTLETHTHNYKLTTFGSWNFDRYIYPGFYNPSPCLDFHPYWRMPGMPDWATGNPDTTSAAFANNLNPVRPQTYVNVLESSASCYGSYLRDFAAESNWFGFAYADNFNTGNNNFRGARLEEDVIAWGSQNGKDKGTEFLHVFDYVKQDTLNRFDMFRGVISRAPFAKRQDSTFASIRDTGSSYWHPANWRASGSAPVAPSGEYLMNLGNYTDYLIGPASGYQAREEASFVHFSTDVTNFYDMRFRYEYVWMNSKYFPVYSTGGSKYWSFRDEITGIPKIQPTLFDGGAWTGHKDDITSSEWAGNKKLRWAELFGGGYLFQGIRDITQGTSILPFMSGGYSLNTSGSLPSSTGKTQYSTYMFGTDGSAIKQVKRSNFFTDVYPTQRLRLAVGPRVPNTVELIMNLTLPTRLKG